MSLRFTNTLGGAVDEFTPLEPGQVRMYTCGPTVYGPAHIGHALMALCFCWAYRTGQWLTRTEPLKIKKHGRLAKSIFRHGFDQLRRILCNQDCSVERLAFIKLCKLLSCT